jgi:hypothetical protein
MPYHRVYVVVIFISPGNSRTSLKANPHLYQRIIDSCPPHCYLGCAIRNERPLRMAKVRSYVSVKNEAGRLVFLAGRGSVLLNWTRFSLRRSLRRVRSNERLYQALAERETDEASRELYQLLARNERSHTARKLSSLFSLGERVPTIRDSLHAKAWRRFLVLCGPKKAAAYIEWRERRELTMIIAVARIITRLARPRGRDVPRSTS